MKGIEVRREKGVLHVAVTVEWPGYKAVENAVTHDEWDDGKWDRFWESYLERAHAASDKAILEYLDGQ